MGSMKGTLGAARKVPATWKHGFSRIPSNSNMVIINVFAICYLRVFWWYSAKTMFTPTMFSRRLRSESSASHHELDSQAVRFIFVLLQGCNIAWCDIPWGYLIWHVMMLCYQMMLRDVTQHDMTLNNYMISQHSRTPRHIMSYCAWNHALV